MIHSRTLHALEFPQITEHLASLCQDNPALNCSLSSAGPSLGALLPPPPAVAYSQSTSATPRPSVVWRWL